MITGPMTPSSHRGLRDQIFRYFGEKISVLKKHGVHDIIIDPGIGFGKTLEHNLDVLAHLERLRVHDRPLVVGVSRKSFLAKLIGSSEISDRLAPAVALTSPGGRGF